MNRFSVALELEYTPRARLARPAGVLAVHWSPFWKPAREVDRG